MITLGALFCPPAPEENTVLGGSLVPGFVLVSLIFFLLRNYMCTYLCARVLLGEMGTGKKSTVLRASSRQMGPVGRGFGVSLWTAASEPHVGLQRTQVLWVLRGPSISPSPAGLGPRHQLPVPLTTWSACPVQPRGPRALVPPLAGPGPRRAEKDVSAPLPCSQAPAPQRHRSEYSVHTSPSLILPAVL